jgi:hypothetical protein
MFLSIATIKRALYQLGYLGSLLECIQEVPN